MEYMAAIARKSVEQFRGRRVGDEGDVCMFASIDRVPQL